MNDSNPVNQVSKNREVKLTNSILEKTRHNIRWNLTPKKKSSADRAVSGGISFETKHPTVAELEISGEILKTYV